VASVVPGRADVGGETVNLPKQIGEWSRPDAARRITAETIFDYMDGAGELYLAYRFEDLDVFEYKAADASLGTILVEIYSMKTSDDAFGLLSNDWGGEAVAFDPGPGRFSLGAVPPRRALYGGGLLRMWAASRYVRILASRETDDSRQAVLAVGKHLMAPDPQLPPQVTPPPGFLRAFDQGPDAKRPVRPDRTCFFRSHLVLNSAYFLASHDILGLGPEVSAATTEYAPGGPGERPTRLIMVRYPSEAHARAALESFSRAYLADVQAPVPPPSGEARVEHGWVGWSLIDAGRLTLVLDAPDRQLARRFARAVFPPRSDAWM